MARELIITVGRSLALFLGLVLAVSHFYHLPRVKLAYRRVGLDVYTVPARSIYWLRGLPRYLLREIAALWAYYLQPLWL